MSKRVGRTKTAAQYAEDNPWCEACRQHGTAEIHHIARRALADTDTPANLLALCKRDHDFYHLKGWEQFNAEFPHLADKVNAARRAHRLRTELRDSVKWGRASNYGEG